MRGYGTLCYERLSGKGRVLVVVDQPATIETPAAIESLTRQTVVVAGTDAVGAVLPRPARQRIALHAMIPGGVLDDPQPTHKRPAAA